MAEQLFAHIGVPVMAGLILVVLKLLSSPDAGSWALCTDMALDFAFLSVGATGAIFIDTRIADHWGKDVSLYGIGVVLANLFLAAILALIRRRRVNSKIQVGPVGGVLDLFLGLLALCVTSSVIYVGYRSP
jgi:hypothetical protein